MDFINITEENLAKEHLCCAITENRGENGISLKKEWLRRCLREGLVFQKLDVRGKVFIEYLPAEYAFCPISAPGWMFINCLWVSGKFAGQGYGGELLNGCIRRAKEQGKLGLVALSSQKKKPFLSDPGFFLHSGFQVCDTAEPYFQLYCLPFSEDAEKPRFLEHARRGENGRPGFTLYYSHQCPHAANYAPKVEKLARQHGAPMELVLLETAEQAQLCPSPFPTYSLFYEGKFLTNEVLSEKKFENYLAQYGC